MSQAQRPNWGEIPEGAEEFVVTHKSIIVSANRLEDLDEETLEEYGIEIPPEPDNRFEGHSVVFNEGEFLPPELAREMYDGFGDRIGVFDDEGTRLDEPRYFEGEGHALHTGPEIPEGAVRFEMLDDTLGLAPSKIRDLPDETIEEYGIDVDARGSGVIEPGEEIPPDVVATVYGSFHDKIAVYDEEGERIA